MHSWNSKRILYINSTSELHEWDMHNTFTKVLIPNAILQIQELFATTTYEQIQILRPIDELVLWEVPGLNPTPLKLPALVDCILLVI